MITSDVNSIEGIEIFFDMLKNVMIKNIEDDSHLRYYSLNWSGNKEAFQLIVLHFKERLGDIAKIKIAPMRRFCGFDLRGIDIDVLTDNVDLFRERVKEMFNGQYISYV